MVVVGDKVYVYSEADYNINVDMFGEVVDVRTEEDWLGEIEGFYQVKIKLKNGDMVTVKQKSFSKYNYIKVEDLKNLLISGLSKIEIA